VAARIIARRFCERREEQRPGVTRPWFVDQGARTTPSARSEDVLVTVTSIDALLKITILELRQTV
jgi:hypothetical protein